MKGFKKFKVFFAIVGLIVLTIIIIFIAIPAPTTTRDIRFQGSWQFDGSGDAALLFHYPNFVWTADFWGGSYLGLFSVGESIIVFGIMYFICSDSGDWSEEENTIIFDFYFQTEDTLVINDWIYRRVITSNE